MNIDRFIQAESALGVRRTAVLGVTLWMTWRSFKWAAEFAHTVPVEAMLGGAALIAAVLAPIAYLQQAVFTAYIKSKESND